MRETLINGRWPIILPDHRADFHEERPWWEAARLADMYAHVEDGMVIYDVGAECGDFSALYQMWGGRVIMFEPNPLFIPTIQLIAQANHLNVDLMAGFVADTVASGPFGEISSTEVLEQDLFIEPGFYTLGIDKALTTTLDVFAGGGRVPDMVVIDVEGSEDKVLRGATKLLERDIIWWISIHGDVDPHAPLPSPVHKYMRSFGYRDQWLGHQHEWFYRFYR